MDVKSLDLKMLREPLEAALSAYENATGMKFEDFPDLILTPEKPNSARTVIPVTYETVKIGDLYALAFMQGDGTGDSKTYQLQDVVIPPEFQHSEKPERVIPRAKTGVVCEGFFPLFSLTSQGDIALFAASLDELGLVDTTLTRLWRLGQTDEEYARALQRKEITTPKVYLTVGESAEGKRMGDPHAIYYNRALPDALQVVGFLGTTDANNPLKEISESLVLPSRKE